MLLEVFSAPVVNAPEPLVSFSGRILSGPQLGFALSPIHSAARNRLRMWELQGTAAKSSVFPMKTTRPRDKQGLVKF